ncbi:MAG: DNA-binding response regulator, partial [Elusimicrobia bacterium]|nr:DNA-binding response regulator [Elusimicrobiota bacterium]
MILSKNQIYILDDEAGVRISIETILSADGYNVKAF